MWAALIPVLGTVIDKIFPNAEAAATAKLKLMEMAQAGELAALDADVKVALGQMEINKAEAASGSKFASSWRPLIGYVCAVALVYNFIFYPVLLWAKALWFPAVTAPKLMDDKLFELLLGMLGLAGFRTFEKVKGVSK